MLKRCRDTHATCHTEQPTGDEMPGITAHACAVATAVGGKEGTGAPGACTQQLCGKEGTEQRGADGDVLRDRDAEAGVLCDRERKRGRATSRTPQLCGCAIS